MSERKSLSYLIEAEMDKATVLMASKGITDNLQKMAEDVAMMVAKDVMPLGDTMREVFGLENAKAFQSVISEKLNSLVTSISEVKDSINEQIDALESGETPSDLNTDSTDDLFGDGEAEGSEEEIGDEEFSDMGSEERGMKDDEEEEDFGDLDDVFADASAGAGRGMKEGATPLHAPLATGDARIAREFSTLIREGKDVEKAARLIAETYAIGVAEVAKIVSKAKGR